MRQVSPGWAQRERQADFGWIRGSPAVFWTAATTALEDAGRRTIVVDTTLQADTQRGHPFGYFFQEQAEGFVSHRASSASLST